MSEIRLFSRMPVPIFNIHFVIKVYIIRINTVFTEAFYINVLFNWNSYLILFAILFEIFWHKLDCCSIVIGRIKISISIIVFVPMITLLPSIVLCRCELFVIKSLNGANVSKLRFFLIIGSFWSKTNSYTLIVFVKSPFWINFKASITSILSCCITSSRTNWKKSSIPFKLSRVFLPSWFINCSWVITTCPKRKL